MNYRKRVNGEDGFSSNGGFFKKPKQELESLATGVRSNLTPCTKFFSTIGCSYGENCHFLHYVRGGYEVVAQMMNLPISTMRTTAATTSITNGSIPTMKTRRCTKYNTAEGCKYGEKCHFAHGEQELKRSVAPSHDYPRAMGSHLTRERLPGKMEPKRQGPVYVFGASATAKISVDASLAGAIIGKGGMNSKQIYRETGAKLCVRDHESDPNLKNIKLEGTFEQIAEASAMVKELISTLGSAAPHRTPSSGLGDARKTHPAGNLKTKLCEKFAKGTCTFGNMCHFAHGETELRKPLEVAHSYPPL